MASSHLLSSDQLTDHEGVFVSNGLGAENLSLRYDLASFISCYGYVKLDQSFPKGVLKLLNLLFNLSANKNGQVF